MNRDSGIEDARHRRRVDVDVPLGCRVVDGRPGNPATLPATSTAPPMTQIESMRLASEASCSNAIATLVSGPNVSRRIGSDAPANESSNSVTASTGAASRVVLGSSRPAARSAFSSERRRKLVLARNRGLGTAGDWDLSCVEAFEQAQDNVEPGLAAHLAGARHGDRLDRHRRGSNEEGQGHQVVGRDVGVDHHRDRFRRKRPTAPESAIVSAGASVEEAVAVRSTHRWWLSDSSPPTTRNHRGPQ